MEREVVLCDEQGKELGTCEIYDAHAGNGKLHKAFSVVLQDPKSKEVLVQLRAITKPVFPNKWANSVCSHPFPGEEIGAAGVRRVREELGIDIKELKILESFVYRAPDPETKRGEYEFDTVLFGELAKGTPLNPDPGEIAATDWDSIADLLQKIDVSHEKYGPWFKRVLEIVHAHNNANE